MAQAASAEKDCSDVRSHKDAISDRVKSQIENGVAQTQETLEEVASQTADEIRKVSDQGTKFVRENPALAVAGAVGVGVLVGLALRGRG